MSNTFGKHILTNLLCSIQIVFLVYTDQIYRIHKMLNCNSINFKYPILGLLKIKHRYLFTLPNAICLSNR